MCEEPGQQLLQPQSAGGRTAKHSTTMASHGSLMGFQHELQARTMTLRSLTAAVALLAVFCMACAPLLFFMPLGLVLYGAAEAVFLVLYWYRCLQLSYQPIKHRPLGHDPVTAFLRTIQHLHQEGADIRSFLSIWFHGARFSSIKRDNVKDMIAYAFWYKTPADVAAEGRAAELEQQVALIEATWGLQLEPGYDPELCCMCHLWEPMKHWYRPLAFYLVMEAAALMCWVALRAAGFQRHVWMGLAYYTKNMPEPTPQISMQSAYPSCHSPSVSTAAVASATAASPRPAQAAAAGEAAEQGTAVQQSHLPLVLVHGIGMGLIPYISFLFNLAATGRPVMALELPHISMRWVLWVPTVDEVAEVLVSVLNRNAVSSCCLIGHSYGTAVASRLLQQQPQRIQQLALIDPICFAMFMPNLLRNFLYESPRSGSWLGDFMMMSAARDLHVSATLSRRFFWSDVNLWEEQLPPGSLVVLSGRDVLMAAPEVKAWLEQHTKAVVMYHPELAHAGFLLDITWQQQILQQLLPLLDSAPSPKPFQPSVPEQQQHQQLLLPGGDVSHPRVLFCRGSDTLGPCISGKGSNVCNRWHHFDQVAASAESSTHGPPSRLFGSAPSPMAISITGNGSHTSRDCVCGSCCSTPGSWHEQLAACQLNGSATPSTASCGSSTAGSSGAAAAMPAAAAAVSGRSVSRCPGNSMCGSFTGSHQSYHSAESCGSNSNNNSSSRLQYVSAVGSAAGFAGVVPFDDISSCAFDAAGSTATACSAGAGMASTPSWTLSNGPFSSGQLPLLQCPGTPHSRQGSLELSPSLLCIRSWSGVIPAPGLTPTASTSSALESGVPESPRSSNTFFSACSTQSRRDVAAAATAQEAARVAHMLLQPLMTMQQRKPQQQQCGLGGAGRGPAVEVVGDRCPEHTGGGGAACVVLCSSSAAGAKPAEGLRARRGSTGEMDGAKREGVFKRVEELWYRRQNRA